MKLIASSASPFVRKVRVVIRETGQTDAIEEVSVVTTPLDSAPQAVSANPTGKIPALIRDDGPAIYDSRVITRFLDAQTGGALYPEARIWEVLTLEATADAILDAAVLMVYEKRLRPEPIWSTDWIEAQWGKITRGLAAIEDRWMSHLSGPLDASQIAVGCACGYLDFRNPDRGWRKDVPALDDWFAVFSERPSMVATRPE